MVEEPSCSSVIVCGRVTGETGAPTPHRMYIDYFKREVEVFYAQSDPVDYQDFTDYLVTRAEFAFRAGAPETARSYLLEAAGILNGSQGSVAQDSRTRRMFHRARWVSLNGAFSDVDQALAAASPLALARPEGPERDCQDADLYARQALIEGRQAEAVEQVDFLVERGYRYPDFLHFCRSRGLCAGDD